MLCMENDVKWTIEQLKVAQESEDRVEFKRANGGDFSYDGGTRIDPAARRKCILGYVIALCNEGGGALVLGMEDKLPHKIVGTRQSENALGVLEANIYRSTGIRPSIYELYEDEEAKVGRVLVIEVPHRPKGKVYKFEDVALMRVGEELKPMSDERYFTILQESEPDFSEQICDEATFADLDDKALDVLRNKYAIKQHNPRFLTLENEQLLSDLKLIRGKKITNAAILLLGKKEFLQRVFPQATIQLEYRQNPTQIRFDNRTTYQSPFLVLIDKLWRDINLHNKRVPLRDGPYIVDIPYFNEEVIREAIHNAVAHRDYRRTSEIVIKLSPQQMTILNAGGFPNGVTLENILTVPSTPRNRLLADIMSKIGLVERSGQGVDKIFYSTLQEGKAAPDYSASDDFHVELLLSGVIQDQGFALFIDSVQQDLPDDQKLSVLELQTLVKIRDGAPSKVLNRKVIDTLLKRNLIEKRGKTKGSFFILCRSYYELAGRIAEYHQKDAWSLDQFLSFITSGALRKGNALKMGDFVKLLEGHMTRRQVKTNIQHLVEKGVLSSTGEGAATRYVLSKKYKQQTAVVDEALRIGLTEIIKRSRECPKNVQKDDENTPENS